MSSSAEASTTDKKIELKSSDGQMFLVDEKVAVLSRTLEHMIEDGCADNVIPLANVSGKILAKLIEYCSRHLKQEGEEKDDEVLKEFDAEFIKVDQNTLYDLMMAANYLDIKGLLDLTCQTVADMIKGKSPEEIRELLNIKNDFTEEEEEEIRKDNAWAFE